MQQLLHQLIHFNSHFNAIYSPGFLNSELLNYIFENAVTTENRAILSMRDKFMTCHTSCGYKSALQEIFTDPIIQSKISGMKAIDEVIIILCFIQTQLLNDLILITQ